MVLNGSLYFEFVLEKIPSRN